MKTHLIIKALHRDNSFLAQGTNILEKTLIELNENVIIRDLYKMNFDPVLTSSDFEQLKKNTLPEDIKHEQEFIRISDYLWFIFPVWWTNMPAILKGYIDRIFLSGFAYHMAGDHVQGRLKGKQAIILNSMGESREHYAELGMFDAIEKTIDLGILGFCGVGVIAHKYFTSIMSVNKDVRKKYLKDIENLAVLITNEQPVIIERN